MTQRAWSFRRFQTDPVVVEDSVREAWDASAALAAAEPGNLFPSRVGWVAASHDAAVLRNLEGQAASGYRASPAEIVPVPKSDRTTRPAADMSTEDGILYAAIVNALVAKLPDGLVTFTDDAVQDYQDFERFPLDQPGVRYIVEGDAAAYFQYIDYERLAYELIGLTGWADAVEPLVRLLETWMGPAKGIPQGPATSRLLGDIFISPVARRLARSGWIFSRYSDDFRIVARSWSHAREAHYALEAALAERGLVTAANKARTYGRDKYRQRLDKIDVARLAGEASRHAFEELEEGPYAPEEAERAPVTQEDVTRAQQVLGEQVDILPVDVTGTRLIRRALRTLGNGASPYAVQHLRKLQSRYPHLTQATSGYLRLLMGTDAEGRAVTGTIRWLTSNELRLPWQIGWMLNALCFATRSDDRVAAFALDILGDTTLPWFVQGRAALAASIHGHLPSLERFVSIYELSPAQTRPDLIGSVVIGQPRWAQRFLEGSAESPLLAAVSALDPQIRRDWI